MKMTTDIKYKYYEFKVPENEYQALIAADSKEYAIAKYYEDVIDDCDYEVDCKEIPSSLAWHKLLNANLSDGLAINELIRTFDEPGLLIISEDLCQDRKLLLAGHELEHGQGFWIDEEDTGLVKRYGGIE